MERGRSPRSCKTESVAVACLLTVSYVSTPRESCLNDSTVLKEELGETGKMGEGGREGIE